MAYFRFDFDVPDEFLYGQARSELTVGGVRDVLRNAGVQLEGFLTSGPGAETPGLTMIVSGSEPPGPAGQEVAAVMGFRLQHATEIDRPYGVADPGIEHALPEYRVYCPSLKKVVPVSQCPDL
jgi:hypothetical protein